MDIRFTGVEKLQTLKEVVVVKSRLLPLFMVSNALRIFKTKKTGEIMA